MYSLLNSPPADTLAAQWLIPVETPAGAKQAVWYAALTLGASGAQDKAYTALAWLLRKLERYHYVLTPKCDPDADEILLVASCDELAVAIADTAVALFIMTGAFTQDQAEAFLMAEPENLLVPVYVPTDVLSPRHEATSRWGLASPHSHSWFWEEVSGQEPARQGMLRAITETEAIARLREASPELGAFKWISRRDYQNYPLGVDTTI